MAYREPAFPFSVLRLMTDDEQVKDGSVVATWTFRICRVTAKLLNIGAN